VSSRWDLTDPPKRKPFSDDFPILSFISMARL
jgi:hypothetical protein